MDPHWRRLLVGAGWAVGVVVLGLCCLGAETALIAGPIAGVTAIIDLPNKTALAVVRLLGIFAVIGLLAVGFLSQLSALR